MSQRRAAITAVGIHVPERVMTNADLEKIVDTSDEWIRTRTGIHQRHVVEKGTPTSVIAALAAQDALRRRGIGADEIDLIVVATVTPDMLFPATACLVQDRIGAKKAWGFDVSAACSGFAYALTVGAQFVVSGAHRKSSSATPPGPSSSSRARTGPASSTSPTRWTARAPRT
jgi:3-oxoacyl-[acyl-carrier-protein] synthase-3